MTTMRRASVPFRRCWRRRQGCDRRRSKRWSSAPPSTTSERSPLPDETLREAQTASRSPGFEAHTTLGYRLLKGHDSEPFRTTALIALGHHERFDGKGYPTGMSGDHIPLAARIVAIADRLDALRLGAPEASWPEIWESARG